MKKNELPKSNDALNAGRLLPEVVGFSFFHLPEDENVVNGFKFDVRLGDDTFSVKFFNGDTQNENQTVKYLVDDPKHAGLINDRHELIHAAQEQVLHQSAQICALFENLKSTNL